MIVVISILVVLAIIFSFITGLHYGIHKKAKQMMEEMLIGNIIIDMSSAEEDLIKCQFDKNPKEWIDKNYILLEVKIRQ